MPARNGHTSPNKAERLKIEVSRQSPPELAGRLVSLFVEETTAGLYRCEATFDNWGPVDGGLGVLYLDRRTFEFGRPFTVRAGSGPNAAPLFDGKITGLEGRFPWTSPPQITVLAEDRFQDLRMTRRTRTFEDAADGEVIAQIAGAHGLTPLVDLGAAASIRHAVLAQVNQSDLAFLRTRARAVDAEIWMEGTELHVQSRTRRRAGEVSLTYGENLYECTVLADVAAQRTSLAVTGWDASTKTELTFEADATAIQQELDGLESGASVLQTAFGQRPERIVHMAPFNVAETRSLAEARYRSLARRFVTGRGVAEGDARIRVGVRLRLAGLSNLFDGLYYVTETRHVLDRQDGHLTHFAVERPGLGRP